MKIKDRIVEAVGVASFGFVCMLCWGLLWQSPPAALFVVAFIAITAAALFGLNLMLDRALGLREEEDQ